MEKDNVVYIDINTLPPLSQNGKKLSWSEVMRIFHEKKLFLYDGRDGDKPFTLEGNSDIVVYDINSKEGVRFCKKHNLKINEVDEK